MIPSFATVVLLYRASRDGFNSASFLSKCTGKENTVMIVQTNSNYIFGGYASSKWSNSGSVADTNAFIFSLRRNGTSNNYKLPINPASVNNAIYTDSSYVRFGMSGNYDICIHPNSNVSTGSQSQIGCYNPPIYPSGSDYRTFLAGSYDSWLTTEIEVYQIFK